MTQDAFYVQSDTTQVRHDAQKSPFSSLRLTQNFGETLGVKKALTTVPVGSPSKDRLFRTHPTTNLLVPAILKVAQVSPKRTLTLKAPEATKGEL